MLYKVGYEMLWLGFRALRLSMTVLLAAVLAILFVLTIFLYSGSEDTLPHPIPMPNTPVELATLPTRAEIRCRGTVVPVAARDYVSVWARPGVNPDIPTGDSDSTYWRPVEETHPQIGRLLQCTEVEVTNYAWSELGGEFYDETAYLVGSDLVVEGAEYKAVTTEFKPTSYGYTQKMVGLGDSAIGIGEEGSTSLITPSHSVGRIKIDLDYPKNGINAGDILEIERSIEAPDTEGGRRRLRFRVMSVLDSPVTSVIEAVDAVAWLSDAVIFALGVRFEHVQDSYNPGPHSNWTIIVTPPADHPPIPGKFTVSGKPARLLRLLKPNHGQLSIYLEGTALKAENLGVARRYKDGTVRTWNATGGIRWHPPRSTEIEPTCQWMACSKIMAG